MDVNRKAGSLLRLVAPYIKKIRGRRNQDDVIRRLVFLIDTIDIGPPDREEIVDDAPHARPRQVEGLLDAGMFDFAFAGSTPA